MLKNLSQKIKQPCYAIIQDFGPKKQKEGVH